MISAERMKSVRTAPLILARSASTRSAAASGSAATGSTSSWLSWSPPLPWKKRWNTFSNPSKQR